MDVHKRRDAWCHSPGSALWQFSSEFLPASKWGINSVLSFWLSCDSEKEWDISAQENTWWHLIINRGEGKHMNFHIPVNVLPSFEYLPFLLPIGEATNCVMFWLMPHVRIHSSVLVSSKEDGQGRAPMLVVELERHVLGFVCRGWGLRPALCSAGCQPVTLSLGAGFTVFLAIRSCWRAASGLGGVPDIPRGCSPPSYLFSETQGLDHLVISSDSDFPALTRVLLVSLPNCDLLSA